VELCPRAEEFGGWSDILCLNTWCCDASLYHCCICICHMQSMITFFWFLKACTDRLLVSGLWNFQAESLEWVISRDNGIRLADETKQIPCLLPLHLHIQSRQIHQLCWVLPQPKTSKWLVMWFMDTDISEDPAASICSEVGTSTCSVYPAWKTTPLQNLHFSGRYLYRTCVLLCTCLSLSSAFQMMG
jgi:hypothetical protein